LENTLKDVIIKINEKKANLKSNKFLKLADWGKVEETLELNEMLESVVD